MKLIQYPFILIFLFSSCTKNNTSNPTTVTAKTEMNVSYGTSSQQKMDIYLPAGRSAASSKVLIMIHGGGWNQGDKADFNIYIDSLKKRLPGYAIININYRLATGTPNLFPTQENDVKAAIEFIFSKRSEYLISDKFVLLGASAGGHLSLLHAYKNNSPVKIKAVVDFFGPTDLINLYNNPPSILIPILLIQVTGGIPATHASLYQQSSPTNFINSQSPPTIILQGGADIVVPAAQSVILKNKLQAEGVIHEYVFYPTENHGWTGPNLVDSFDKIVAFLNANVK